MSITQTLRHGADPIWERCHRHPFVTGIGDGTLPDAKFAFYLAQDYVYLIEYARLFAIGIAKAPDLETMTRLTSLLHATLHVEMDLHRTTCAAYGLGTVELEATIPAPECQGYASYLLSEAWRGDSLDFFALLLPCLWSYAEIAERLRDRGLPDHPAYREWITSYASPEYGALVAWARKWMDWAGEDISSDRLRQLQRLFDDSSAWELRFWDMAWRGTP